MILNCVFFLNVPPLGKITGVAAIRASTPPELEQAIRVALSLNGPTLIHVPCGPMPSPWDMIHMPRVRGS